MSSISPESIQGIINVDDLLARCLGNVDIAERILTKFQDRIGLDLEELERGVNQQNAGAIAQVAHRIKGASANVSAPLLYELASEIEQLGRAERISEIPPGIEQLRNEWVRFVHGVSTLELSQCIAYCPMKSQ